jgi:diguanylate cyclase (GGDEF)-like protein
MGKGSEGRARDAAAPARARRPDATLVRFRIMQWIRATAALLVLLAVALAESSLQPHPERLVPLTVAFTCAGVLAGLVVSVRPDRGLPVLRTMLVVDAFWLTVGAHVSGGSSSPLLYAVLLHLAAVTLLANYRTGLVLALLDTAVLVGLHAAVSLDWLGRTAPAGPAGQHLVIFLVVLWLVASSTTVLSVMNERELRRRRHDLEALSALTQRIERSADPATVAQTLLEAVVSSYGLRRGVVLASQDGSLPLLASYGREEALAAEPGRPGPSAVVSQAHREHGTVVARRLDPEQDAWLRSLLPAAGTLLVVPLTMDARPIGALVVEHGGRPRAQRAVVAGLQRSAAYGALALRNAWLLAGVQRLAATDGLTKIANRRSFELTLEREVSRATRTAEHLSLVMVDIDHFKQLNDSLGHQGGDEVLRNAAASLAMACREFDTAARYGGEEFAVILPGAGPEEAFEVAERLRQAVAAAPNPLPITASAGVATFPAHAGDGDSLVRAADQALYASKRAGRDRTTASAGIPPEEQVHALIRRAVRERLKAKEGRTDADAMSALFDT